MQMPSPETIYIEIGGCVLLREAHPLEVERWRVIMVGLLHPDANLRSRVLELFSGRSKISPVLVLANLAWAGLNINLLIMITRFAVTETINYIYYTAH